MSPKHEQERLLGPAEPGILFLALRKGGEADGNGREGRRGARRNLTCQICSDGSGRSGSTRSVALSSFFLGLIGMMPLQFCDFSDVPLQFSYLQPCHYNSLSTWLMPFFMAAATSGPPAGRRTHTILPYGRLCPSPTRIEPVDSVALTPWLSLALLAFPLPTNPNPRS